MRASNHGYDSCALMAHLSAHPTRQGIERVLEGLECMEHRTGIVTGESDGVGVMVDVPRDLWAEHVGELAYAPTFWVAHLFLPKPDATRPMERIAAILQADGWRIAAQRWHEVNSEALGACARREEPVFVQIAGQMPAGEPCPERALFQRHLQIERETTAHVVSLSRWGVVYKVQGSARTLRAYYPDLQSQKLNSAITIGHSRYSTNTLPAFCRVQPFSILAHNGEINTIDRLRREARMLGVTLSIDGSDSQDTDRLLHHLLVEYDLSLAEALEVLFPSVWAQVARMPEPKRAVYQHIRAFLGPVAQGPAAIIARWGDVCAFATDALGLRPLWLVPTEEGLYVCSERASLPMEIFTDDPAPLAPGEKVIAQVVRGQTVAHAPRMAQLLHGRLGLLGASCPKWRGADWLAGLRRTVSRAAPREAIAGGLLQRERGSGDQPRVGSRPRDGAFQHPDAAGRAPCDPVPDRRRAAPLSGAAAPVFAEPTPAEPHHTPRSH